MKKLWLLIFLGFLIRLLLISQLGFEADIAFWKTWSLAAADKGIVWLTQNTNYNYPAGFTYILWIIGRVYRLFANPQNFNQYWQANNFLFLFLAKLPSIIADLAVGLSIWLLFKKSSLALFLAGVYLFHPVVLFDGAWWGQVDSLGVAFLLYSLLFLNRKKPLQSSVIITIGFLLKLQTIIFLPLFFLYIWLVFSWKEMVKCLTAAAITFFIISLPFFLARDFGRTFILIFQNSDWFPLISLRADNLWWLVSRGAGMQTSDKILTLGITTAKTLGLILFSASYLLATGLVVHKPNSKNLLWAYILVAFAFFLLPTQSHERYLFPALILFLLTIPDFRQTKMVFSLFAFLSLTTLINLNNSMVANYPSNGIGWLSFFTRPEVDLFISLINLLFFVIFLFFILKKLPKIWTLAAGVVIAAGILFTNLNYLTHSYLSLSQLKPVDYKQDYGIPQMNLNVSSMFGAKNWSFLSVNYFFYPKGIGTHANSRIVYDLGRKFSRFSTDYGVDTAAPDTASVIFVIYGDDRLLFSSPKMIKSDLPRHIEIPVQGVKTLNLTVHDAGDGISGDHADWLEPTLYKK